MLTRLLPWLYATLRVGRWLRNPLLERIYLALLFAYKRYAEDPFAALARRRPDLFRGGHILDVGANVGYTATVFARAAGDEYRVYAFEPEPLNLRRLRHVIDARRLADRIAVIESAVGDANGEVELLINESHPGDHRVSAETAAGPRVRVAITTLDEFVAGQGVTPVRFIKIDVQGLELAVSRGMKGVIDRNRRLAVAFEYHQPSARAWGYEAADLVDFYSERGFDLFVLNHRGELLDASPLEIARVHEQRGYVDLLALREGGS
jgi:FkbM family methyltransferase